jgi:Mg2+ and Co2+ transporter CorA
MAVSSVDVPSWDPEVEAALGHVFRLHPLVIDACRRRNHTPTVHGYEDHVFLTLHTPLVGQAGHVHLLELDQVVGRTFLVTVHGPLNPAVDEAEALAETDAVLRRIQAGRFAPRSPAEVSYAVASAIARRQRDLIATVAEKIPDVEQQVMAGDFRQPEIVPEEMFLIRHELITARTMAAQSCDVYSRLTTLERLIPEQDEVRKGPGRPVRPGPLDRRRISVPVRGDRSLPDSRQRQDDRRDGTSAVIAASFSLRGARVGHGMNVIVNQRTHWTQLAIIILVMPTLSALLLRWATPGLVVRPAEVVTVVGSGEAAGRGRPLRSHQWPWARRGAGQAPISGHPARAHGRFVPAGVDQGSARSVWVTGH